MKYFYHREKNSSRFIREVAGRLIGLRSAQRRSYRLGLHVRCTPLTQVHAAFTLSA